MTCLRFRPTQCYQLQERTGRQDLVEVPAYTHWRWNTFTLQLCLKLKLYITATPLQTLLVPGAM